MRFTVRLVKNLAGTKSLCPVFVMGAGAMELKNDLEGLIVKYGMELSG